MPLYAPATQPRPVRTEFDPVRQQQQVSAIDQRPVERENLAQKLRDIASAGSGKYYRIQFVKRTTGGLRDMLARWPIKPFNAKTGHHRSWNPEDYGLVQAQEGDGKYRLIPINNVLRIRGEGRELRRQNNQKLLEPEDRKYAKDYARRPYYTPGEGPNDERPKGMTQNYAESLREMVAFALPVGRGTPFAPPTSPWQGGQYAPKGYREKLLSSMNMVPVFLPSGQTQPSVGVTPTGGTVPPPKNTAMIGTPQRPAGAPQMPKRQFSLRDEVQQFKLGEDSHEEVMRKMPTAIHRTGLRHLIGDRAAIPQGNSLEQLQQRMGGRSVEAPVQRAADRREPRQRSEPDIAGMMSVSQSDLPEVRVQMPGSAPIRHARGVHDLTAMDPEKMRNILQSRMTKGAQRPQYTGQREHENLRSAIARVLDQYGSGNEPIVVPDDGQEFKRDAPGREDSLLENFNRMAQQRHGVNGRNRIAGYLGGDVVAGDLPGNVRVGQPPLGDEPTQPQDVPAESMRQQVPRSRPSVLRQIAPQRNRQLQGRSRMTEQQVAEMASRGYGLASSDADRGLVREHQIEDRLTPRPGAPRSASTRSDDGAAGMAQLNAALRPKPKAKQPGILRQWLNRLGTGYNNLSDSLERGYGELAGRAKNWLLDQGDRLLGGQSRPEPKPLDVNEARTWLAEADKRRRPGQKYSRALGVASKAENYRPGGRRFELDEMASMQPQQNFGLREMVSAVNPISNYKNLRKGGFGRLASGAMVGGGLVGDAALTGFHPPLVSLALGRYAQGAAKRNQPERDRAEWMQG